MIDLKKIIKEGLGARDKGFELLGSTIQKVAESVGLGIEDEENRVIDKLPEDIGKDPMLNKEFLEIFKAQHPNAKKARIIINSKRWFEKRQLELVVEQNRQAIAVYEEDGQHYAAYFTFTQNWTNTGWTESLIKEKTSVAKVDASIF